MDIEYNKTKDEFLMHKFYVLHLASVVTELQIFLRKKMNLKVLNFASVKIFV
jgi:hypothetical protein